MMRITINPKSVYGKTAFYPGCDLSRKFAQLLGQTTLTQDNLKIIASMGIDINYVVEFSADQPFL